MKKPDLNYYTYTFTVRGNIVCLAEDSAQAEALAERVLATLDVQPSHADIIRVAGFEAGTADIMSEEEIP